MKYSWIDTELLQKPSVTQDLQTEWNWIRYHIGGKMFAAVCLDDTTGGRGGMHHLRIAIFTVNVDVFICTYSR